MGVTAVDERIRARVCWFCVLRRNGLRQQCRLWGRFTGGKPCKSERKSKSDADLRAATAKLIRSVWVITPARRDVDITLGRHKSEINKNMFFIHPMWNSESQRIGKMKCSNAAFQMHVIGEFIGFIGLLLLLGNLFYCIVIGFFKGYSNIFWSTLLIPLSLGAISEVMVQISWIIVKKKSFNYDYKTDVATWSENGNTITYSYKSAQQVNAPEPASPAR